MSEQFQPPIKKKKDDDTFQYLFDIVDQFFDERPLQKMLETLDDYFQQTFKQTYIPIDVYETTQEYVITAHLPNVNRNQIELEFIDDHFILTVKNNEKMESVNEHTHVYQKKQTYQNIRRTIPLPYSVSEKEIKASFQDGKLVIRFPQRRKLIDVEEN
ncbi:HSP20 family molecular chaperone IbpA [Anoxybacillus vitaminiphilus]|uniref:HSP20 family molecular chaperone IbpA n=1 Tax=Paranoxybacillus vitaminiphilus TaxID=581036 RepID=A0A327YMG7_9BACL|nr:Hsp20/alpha crystallin family protein [Anoxybacillus vitaminiphilus]RAK22100.1 HSP20 family molecular chaperone IbpA [Anoxybacillus vitaminiphilus]